MNRAIKHIISNRMIAATLIIALMVVVACFGGTPPECIEAAEAADMPDKVIEQLRNPGDLNAIERAALNRALSQAGLDDVCEAAFKELPEGPDPANETNPFLRGNRETEESKTTQDHRLMAKQSARIPQNDEHRRRCRFWALNNLQPVVYQEFAKLDPDSMDDLDRILWRSKLHHPNDHLGYYKKPADSQNIPPLMPRNPGIYCRDYWAEPLSRSNADLRNHGFETQCRKQLEKHITKTYSWLGDKAGREEENELVYRTPNQYVRILQWLDLSSDDLMDSAKPPYRILQEQSRHAYAYGENWMPKQEDLDDYQRENQTRLDLEWLSIMGAAGMDSSSSSDLRICHHYYPQVFYGYWIPIDPEENPDSDQKQEVDLPRYEELTTPLYLPEAVTAERVRAGYPLGQSDEQYYTCQASRDTEKIGYYYVDHPAGDYCERIP